VVAGRSAGFMRESDRPIHAPLHRAGEEFEATNAVAAVCSVSV
jgi:hypothetical protein